MALIAGMRAVKGQVMGHAGAFVGPGEGDAPSKARALQQAGVVLANHPSDFGTQMSLLLGSDKLQAKVCFLGSCHYAVSRLKRSKG